MLGRHGGGWFFSSSNFGILCLTMSTNTSWHFFEGWPAEIWRDGRAGQEKICGRSCEENGGVEKLKANLDEIICLQFCICILLNPMYHWIMRNMWRRLSRGWGGQSWLKSNIVANYHVLCYVQAELNHSNQVFNYSGSRYCTVAMVFLGTFFLKFLGPFFVEVPTPPIIRQWMPEH